jgi:hypothetical protein
MKSLTQFKNNAKRIIQSAHEITNPVNGLVFSFNSLNALKHQFLIHGLNDSALPSYQT